jgi:hypothetical protein
MALVCLISNAQATKAALRAVVRHMRRSAAPETCQTLSLTIWNTIENALE